MSSTPSTRGNFFLHIHPERVRQRTLELTTTLGLGVIALVLLGVLLVTGIVLMFWYVPLPGVAYDRMVDLSAGALPLGGLIRDLHRLASDALVVVAVLHMARVFLTGALGRLRRLNWIVGLGLLLFVLATAFTGYLLPWDREAYWAATVGGELIGLIPALGEWLRGLLWGGDQVGEDTLVRAFALHVAALPVLGTLLLAYHLWRIRKAGGLARPRGVSSRSDGNAFVPTRPALTMRELVLGVLVITALLVAAILWDAPLGLPGEPARPLDPAKAPWFFLWIQELVSYSTALGGFIPLLLFALLAAAPLLETKPELVGRWFPRERLARCIALLVILAVIVVLIVIASAYRGPGWRLML